MIPLFSFGLVVVGALALAVLPRSKPLVHREMVVGADEDARLPMVVAIHGYGSNPGRIVEQVGLRKLDAPARIIAPQGFNDAGDEHFIWFPVRAKDPDVQALSTALAAAADRLAAGIRDLMRRRPTAGKPIVVGFSQGGLLTFALAIRHPDIVSYAVPIAGWLPPPLMRDAVAEAPPIAALHGMDDSVVPYDATEQAVEQLAALGWPVELAAYDGVAHSISASMGRDARARLRKAIQSQEA